MLRRPPGSTRTYTLFPYTTRFRSPLSAIPRIGLLHADLDASGGHYAPIRQAELDSTGYDAWLLGHIHKPSLENLSASSGSRPSGYLGSLVDRQSTRLNSSH